MDRAVRGNMRKLNFAETMQHRNHSETLLGGSWEVFKNGKWTMSHCTIVSQLGVTSPLQPRRSDLQFSPGPDEVLVISQDLHGSFF